MKPLRFAPPFPLHSRHDENILRVCSQRRQTIYDATSLEKEEEMRARLRDAGRRYGADGPFGLPVATPGEVKSRHEAMRASSWSWSLFVGFVLVAAVSAQAANSGAPSAVSRADVVRHTCAQSEIANVLRRSGLYFGSRPPGRSWSASVQPTRSRRRVDHRPSLQADAGALFAHPDQCKESGTRPAGGILKKTHRSEAQSSRRSRVGDRRVRRTVTRQTVAPRPIRSRRLVVPLFSRMAVRSVSSFESNVLRLPDKSLMASRRWLSFASPLLSRSI